MIFADAGTLSEPEPLRYTEAEMRMLSAAAQVRVRADAGDKKAKKELKKLLRHVAALKKKAKRSPAAARSYRVLTESGLLVPSQTFAMNG
jgi:hypothetical protein